MSIDYLEDMENAVNRGQELYICPGMQASEWELSNELSALEKKAQRIANARKYQCHIYRLINKADVLSEDAYIVVRKILDPGSKGEPRFQWSVVDTKEAAEMMRDVSQGPSPYFGGTIAATYDPAT